MVDTPLLDQFLSGGKKSVATPLLDQYLTGDKLIPPPANPVVPNPQSIAAGAKQGLMDVSDSLDQVLQPTVGTALGMSPTDEMRSKRRADYEKQYGEDTAAQLGRLGGQIAPTALVTPATAIETGISRLGSGLIARLGATMATGAAGGAAYGAGTNAVNDDGLGQNILSNAAAGAVGGPLVAGAGKLGAMALPAMRSLKANVKVLTAARNAGIPASAVKNVVQRLEDAGLSPDDAVRELSRMGPKATLADIDPSLITEASGLAALGGKPTAILKNRFDERASQANNSTRDLINLRLGPKPDLESEKQAIVDRARILTGPDYTAAKASGTNLNTLNIVDHINHELENAVGGEASQLEKAKSYLYTSNGALKNDVTSLHKVRQALDDTLDRLPREGTSQGTATYRAVSTVRDLIDNKLKSIPEMASADAKFAEYMKVKEGLQLGYEALTKKTNKDDFIKAYNAAAPAMQDTIRKGLRAAISDVMDNSGQGEASGAARLLNKKNVNQEILRAAFGAKGDSVIDAIHNEVAQRGTERAVTSGSQTAERQAVRKRYEGQSGPNLGDFSFGAGLDALGAGGTATAATMVKRGITNKLVSMSESRLGQLTEGSADLLSRQGVERDSAIRVIDQVQKIQNRLAIPNRVEKLRLRLPTTSSPIVGGPFIERAKDYVKEKAE